jgi:RimJ/RimL family protein N-acetyltransferase
MTDSFWQGRHIRLRAVEPSDGEAHFHWNQDSDMTRQLDRIYFPQSRAAVNRWADKTSTQEPAGDAFHFQIENLAGELVGSIGTHRCDPRTGTFSYGVAIRKEHQRRGYASEAIVMVLRYYFQELRYQKATVYVYSFNESSIRLHERLGFQREGCLRRMVFTQGQYFDLIVFGLTAEEYERQHGATHGSDQPHHR